MQMLSPGSNTACLSFLGHRVVRRQSLCAPVTLRHLCHTQSACPPTPCPLPSRVSEHRQLPPCRLQLAACTPALRIQRRSRFIRLVSGDECVARATVTTHRRYKLYTPQRCFAVRLVFAQLLSLFSRRMMLIPYYSLSSTRCRTPFVLSVPHF